MKRQREIEQLDSRLSRLEPAPPADTEEFNPHDLEYIKASLTYREAEEREH